MKAAIVSALRELCEERRFAAGDVLRIRGGFAREMLYVLEGEVEITLAGDSEEPVVLSIGRQSIIGEISFLTGRGATADVRCLTPVNALAIDQAVLAQLEARDPDLAADFSRHLARTAKARLSSDEVLLGDVSEDQAASFEIVMCTTADMMLTAQRLRYDVYCGEFDRPSPYADHDKRVIIDDLDQHGTSFLALKDGDAIGTTRVNLTRQGSLGMLPDIYGMAKTPYYPETGSVITKYAILADYRGGPTYMRLFGAIATFIEQSDTHAIFIDCVPPLARFYATIGFEQCEKEFMHYENGLSVPMVLDVAAYRERMPLAERMRRNRWRR